MNKKILKALASCAMACSVFFAGCGDDPDKLNQTWTVENAYIEAQAQGFTGTFEEFIQHLTNIADVKVNAQGQLVFTLGDGTIVNAGSVVGAKGDKGDTGAQGEQGVKGDKGDTGATGAQGEQGLKGDKGDKGDQGEQGLKGDTGAQGEQGVKGDKGDTGATGAQGEKGDKGEQGEVGRVGFIVTSADQLEVAASVENSYIVLACDIETDSEITLNAVNHNLDFVLDLNGHKITKTTAGKNLVGIRTTGTEYSIKATIKNGEFASLENMDADYGIFMNGNNIDVVIDGVTASSTYASLVTNGNSYDGSLTVTNCNFVATGLDDGAAAYLPANYTYTFENTTFAGYDGVYVKSGTHTFDNCVITANGDTAFDLRHDGNGFAVTGAGLVVDSANGYIGVPPMNLTLTDCEISSANGYGVLVGKTASEGKDAHAYLNSLVMEGCEVTGKLATARYYDEVYVSNEVQLAHGLTVNNSTVVLLNNIDTTECLSLHADDDMVITLDLNNKVINKITEKSNILRVKTLNANASINATIKNGEFTSVDNMADYGIFVTGQNVEIELDNVKSSASYAGFVTNGNSFDGVVVATNCEFLGTLTTGGAAAYLPAHYDYNFTGCTFTGYDGVYIKSGSHVFENCTIAANGAVAYDLRYYGNGFNATGAGLVIDSADGYIDHPEMSIVLNNCVISSENGCAILEGYTAKTGTPDGYLGHFEMVNTQTTGAVSFTTTFED